MPLSGSYLYMDRNTHTKCISRASGFAIKMNSGTGLMNIGASSERVHGGRKKQEWETQWW